MLGRYSLGIGDRFGQQGKAQLASIQKAKHKFDRLIIPVWNKSHREHQIIGTTPGDVRREAEEAVAALHWKAPYGVDADHITKDIVDPYIPCSNFFTIDVADYIGEEGRAADKENFIREQDNVTGSLSIPGIAEHFQVTDAFLSDWADQYLEPIRQAQEIFEHIRSHKQGTAVFEISMDEVDTPQTPLELYFILKMVARKGIPVNTIAPKFTGDFYKGVDYVGNLETFVKEFEQDLLVLAYAKERFNLPADLKISIHSGSDKFSLYPHIHRLLKKHDAGIHLKTAGTTWLEELIGLADAGASGLAMVKKIYSEAFGRYEELTAPYETVINIKHERLPAPPTFAEWSGQTIVSKLEHEPDKPLFDAQLRQFMHCAYKIAAEQGDSFIRLLKEHSKVIGGRVTHNLYNRHIRPLFVGR
ncbi:tagaturonate epimerase family protein [Fodinibius sediminis]|uniref:Tagaturonate epimerase n=1 Tax=Fodinibius sediminis TaxID=1214077 RepID=A0A521E7D5_9BACT|nr:tagaturonate epimerase family protein [Fodinibius sediminis]SMO79848.1 tagaturonate epimerase [Fodinibius sediminis]